MAPPIAPARARTAIAVPELVFWGFALLLAIDYLGLMSQFAALKVTRFGTLLAYGTFAVVVANGGARFATSSGQGRLLLGLMGMAAASLLYAVVKSYVPLALRSHIDYLVLFVVCAALMDRRSRVTRLALVGTLIVMVLVARNVDLLTSGLRVGVFRAGTFMGDGNDFAWGIIALMPLPLFLALGKHLAIMRLFGLAGVCAALLGVVGTQSRGATLGVVAAALYYFLVLSRRRLLGLVVLAVLAAGVVAFSPAAYLSRITNTDVAADSSAQGRLRAWRAATRMALDYPLGVGAGSFNSAYGRFYREDPDEVFGSARWISAHSIYFKVLGESGFLGLLLLLGVLATNYRDNRLSLRFAREHPERSAIEDRWPALLNFGLIGYAVAGTFLGGLTYPHLYLLSGLAIACRRMTVDGATEASPDPVVRRPVPLHPLLAPRPSVGHLPPAHARTGRA